MVTVRQLLQGQASGEVWTVRPDNTVYEAIRFMAEKEVGAVPVVDEQGGLAGIFSERDYTRKIALKERSSKQTAVSEIMTAKVIAVTPSQTLEECMVLMSENRIRHLPVVENGRVIGMISIKDVLNTILSEKEYIIRQLENYITGTG